jgi:hypothetical protein
MSKFSISKAAARKAGELDARVDIVSTAEITLHSRQEFASQIASFWHDAQQRFLLIGRYLVRAKKTLPHGEYEKMITQDLPFSIQVAHQLKSVADAVDSGRFAETELPVSYSAVYQLTTLNDDELRLAKERGLLSPNVSRPRIIKFKHEIRRQLAQEQHREQLLRRRERLLDELRRIDAEIAMFSTDDTQHIPEE